MNNSSFYLLSLSCSTWTEETSVCPRMIKERQKFALHSPSGLLSPSKEWRNEEWDTWPFWFLTPAEPKLTSKEVIYIDTQGILFNTVSRLWGEGGHHPGRKTSQSKSFMLIHYLNWSCQKTSPSSLQRKWDVIQLISNVWKLDIVLWALCLGWANLYT